MSNSKLEMKRVSIDLDYDISYKSPKEISEYFKLLNEQLTDKGYTNQIVYSESDDDNGSVRMFLHYDRPETPEEYDERLKIEKAKKTNKQERKKLLKQIKELQTRLNELGSD